MRKAVNTVTESVESTKFTLILPEEFLIKPKWVIDISPSREIHIYERVKEKDGEPSEIHYKPYLVSKKSGREANTNSWYRGHEYTNIVDLKFMIMSVSAQSNVTKRIRKDEAAVDDDE